jgi:hypothetical protein
MDGTTDSISRPEGAAASTSHALTDEERRRLRAGCERSLQGHGLRTVADLLAELSVLPADDLSQDVYGDAGAVGALEAEVGALLGKPAAVFMPSGIMAQQMMHLHLRTTDEAVTAGIRRLATERKVWAFGGAGSVDTPGLRALELTVGDATLGFTPEEVADAVRQLLPRRDGGGAAG